MLDLWFWRKKYLYNIKIIFLQLQKWKISKDPNEWKESKCKVWVCETGWDEQNQHLISIFWNFHIFTFQIFLQLHCGINSWHDSSEDDDLGINCMRSLWLRMQFSKNLPTDEDMISEHKSAEAACSWGRFVFRYHIQVWRLIFSQSSSEGNHVSYLRLISLKGNSLDQ